MTYIKHEGTYNKQRENTINNRKPQESQQVPQNLWSFLSQNMKNMYNSVPKFSQESNLSNPWKILRNYII